MSTVGAYTMPTPGAVTRLFGTDRYATAAAISSALFDPGTDWAFVATGENFPDGLAAGPAAGLLGAPILLVHDDSVPPSTAAELVRLAPEHIVVVGGTGVVSNSVYAALASYAGSGIERVSSADRYATAAAVSARFFAPGVVAAFAATGVNFPDALSAGSAAAASAGPMLLVKYGSVPAPTGGEFDRVNPNDIYIAGGTGVISWMVEDALAPYIVP
jgi:putative cell wall-binding protein